MLDWVQFLSCPIEGSHVPGFSLVVKGFFVVTFLPLLLFVKLEMIEYFSFDLIEIIRFCVCSMIDTRLAVFCDSAILFHCFYSEPLL